MIAQANWGWAIAARWVHVLSACLLIGATFFFAIVLGNGTVVEDETGAGSLALRARRSLQMLARGLILLLIASGIYNLLLNRLAYERTLPLSHLLLGPHALLALVIAGVLEVGLSSRRAASGRRVWVRITVVLMFITVALASSLKYVREHPTPRAGVQSASMQGVAR